MPTEADKFNSNIIFKGQEYRCAFYGYTSKAQRIYTVEIAKGIDKIDSIEMMYDATTGNFVIVPVKKLINPNVREMEHQLSDAIQNYHA
jgi:hypothetical protein